MKLIEKDDILLFIIIFLQIIHLVIIKILEADINIFWYIALGVCVFVFLLRFVFAIIYNIRHRETIQNDDSSDV